MPILSPNNSNFTAITATSGVAPLMVTFQPDQSRGFYPISDQWDFGDTGTGSATDTGFLPIYTIQHTYTVPGVYSVTLTGTAPFGTPNPSTFTQTNYITVSAPPPPVANFSGTPLSGTAPLSVAFTDLSTNSPTSWAWDFENNGSTDSTLQNPTYIYPTAGTYTVKLTATNAGGSDPEIKTNYITVNAPPPVFYYAGVVGYTSGIVVWTLDWAETSPGIAPYIDNTGLPQEKVGIVFSNPDGGGGARGTATVTATVDGIPAVGGITALVPTDFIYYSDFSVRNGYDGDVGIAGYIGQSNPFVSPFSVASPNLQSSDFTSFDALTIPLSQSISTGGGNPVSVAGFVTPISVSLLTTDIGYNNFFNRRYYLPMKSADQIWIVGTNFLGYGDAFTVDAVVGPDPSTGEKYICSGNSTLDPTGFINIERVAWAGDR